MPRNNAVFAQNNSAANGPVLNLDGQKQSASGTPKNIDSAALIHLIPRPRNLLNGDLRLLEWAERRESFRKVFMLSVPLKANLIFYHAKAAKEFHRKALGE